MNISPQKTLTRLTDENVNLRILVIAMATWAACFYGPIFGHSYTSWDTHDLGFVNFLYFSDALKNGGFPLWNHFIQSGTFFPSFNNIGLYSPFQLIFVALSWVISPVYAYELMIQAAVLIGGVGSYLLFRTYTSDRLIALFGATAFAVTILVPIVGQIGMVISLSSFPWLILACAKIIEDHDDNERLRYVIWGIVGAMYAASGYLWMNLMHLIIAAIFSLGLVANKYLVASAAEKKAVASSVKNLLLFLGAAVLLYGCLQLPGYLSMHFNYGLFAGDFVSPEPRLRSLSANGQYFSYGSIYKALIGAIDPRIYVNDPVWLTELPRWSLGAGWALWVCFLVIPSKRPFGQQAFWLTLMIIALMYSAGNSNFVGDVVRRIPIINANRWWFNGIYYVIICLVVLVVAKVSLLKEALESKKQHNIRLLLVGTASLYLLVYFKSSVFEFVLLTASLIVAWLLGREKNRAWWSSLLTVLIGLIVLSSASIRYSIPSVSTYLPDSEQNGYSQQVIAREKEVAISQNHRRLGTGHDYIFNDEQWLLKKIPFSHGYNNLGNPFYWYVKNEPFLEHLVVVTQNVRPEMEMGRKDFDSDNAFAEAMMSDVRADMGRPTIDKAHFHDLLQKPHFNWQLNNLKVEPNTASMRVTTDAAAFLIFNNVDHPGWDVYVNGKKGELVRANRVFQGVYLEGAGSHDVVFKFRPVLMISLILLPYLALLLCLVAFIKKERNRIEIRAN